MKLNINNEQGVEFLHFIFERELKPPFREGEKDQPKGFVRYFNRDGKKIGYLVSNKHFTIREPFWINIKSKVCKVFEFSYVTPDWWSAIRPYLKSWMENELNVKLTDID